MPKDPWNDCDRNGLIGGVHVLDAIGEVADTGRMTRLVVILGFSGVQALDLAGPSDVFAREAQLTDDGLAAQTGVLAQETIQAEPGAEHSIAELARRATMSPRHFTRCGAGPHRGCTPAIGANRRYRCRDRGLLWIRNSGNPAPQLHSSCRCLARPISEDLRSAAPRMRVTRHEVHLPIVVSTARVGSSSNLDPDESEHLCRRTIFGKRNAKSRSSARPPEVLKGTDQRAAGWYGHP